MVASSIVQRKDWLNNRTKEGNVHLKDNCEQNDLRSIQHNKINPQPHNKAKRLHLNNYGGKQLNENCTNFIEIG